ncbi:hypothetical protein RCO48_04500 [Peribacillus frigoritolerans]|nr:hypothetical protein [Peribacillus frigoritolerans]
MIFFSKIHSFLEEYIDFPPLNLPTRETDKDNFQESDIEKLAEICRQCWELGDGPIQNIVHVLEKKWHIHNFIIYREEKVDAFSQKQIVNGNERYYIVLGNDKKSAARRQLMQLMNWDIC